MAAISQPAPAAAGRRRWRLFQAEFGPSPAGFYKTVRLQIAERMLRDLARRRRRRLDESVRAYVAYGLVDAVSASLETTFPPPAQRRFRGRY